MRRGLRASSRRRIRFRAARRSRFRQRWSCRRMPLSSLGSLLASFFFGFHVSLEAEQVQGPKPPVVFQPAIEIAQRFGVQPVDAVAAFTNLGDELGGVQYAKVFGDGGTADVE